jgi:hypothetical protein
VGVVVGIWYFGEAPRDLPGDELSAIATIGRRLEAATGLRVDQDLCIPAIREALFGWAFYDRGVPVKEWRMTVEEWEESMGFDWGADDHAVEVLSFIPAHPYLWENLDAVMTAAGGRNSPAHGFAWRPNPAHARLRTRWENLSRRDRFLLAMPTSLVGRPFDRLLLRTTR